MPDANIDMERLTAFAKRQLPGFCRNGTLQVRRLRGGLVSDYVLCVAARYVDAEGRTQSKAFVVKRLAGAAVREGKIYETLLGRALGGLAPALYDVEPLDAGAAHLYIEAVTPASRWPWNDVSLGGVVLEQVAKLHCRHAGTNLGPWNYAAELERNADATLSCVESFAASHDDRVVLRSLPGLRRVARQLPHMREELFAFATLPVSVIHGDLHPGNVLIRRRRGRKEPVLLDWARARRGSPLEDVASWLQWLGFWVPEARRKHDSLLTRYLASRGVSGVSAQVRRAYWLAGALNCCAGVISYHLAVAQERDQSSSRRAGAMKAVHDCLRVVRRADAYFGMTPLHLR